MGALHKEWTTAKDGGKLLFVKGTGAKQLDKLANFKEPPPWPFKFDGDLGPNLDKWEAAKKPEDKKKLAQAIQKTADAYLTQLDAKKKEIDAADPKIYALMKTVLKKIQTTAKP